MIKQPFLENYKDEILRDLNDKKTEKSILLRQKNISLYKTFKIKKLIYSYNLMFPEPIYWFRDCLSQVMTKANNNIVINEGDFVIGKVVDMVVLVCINKKIKYTPLNFENKKQVLNYEIYIKEYVYFVMAFKYITKKGHLIPNITFFKESLDLITYYTIFLRYQSGIILGLYSTLSREEFDEYLLENNPFICFYLMSGISCNAFKSLLIRFGAILIPNDVALEELIMGTIEKIDKLITFGDVRKSPVFAYGYQKLHHDMHTFKAFHYDAIPFADLLEKFYIVKFLSTFSIEKIDIILSNNPIIYKFIPDVKKLISLEIGEKNAYFKLEGKDSSCVYKNCSGSEEN